VVVMFAILLVILEMMYHLGRFQARILEIKDFLLQMSQQETICYLLLLLLFLSLESLFKSILPFVVRELMTI